MKTLFKKITQPLIVMLLVIMIILSFIISFTIRSIITNNMDQLCNDIVESKSSEVDYFLHNRIKELESMLTLINVNDTFENNLNIIKLFSQVENNFESLGIVNNDGIKFVTSGTNFFINDRDYYNELLQSKENTYISDPVISKDNNKEIVIILTKIKSNDNQMKYLSGAISIDYIQEVLNKSNAFDFYTTLINDNDEIIMSSGNNVEKSSHKIRVNLNSVDNWSIEVSIPDQFYYKQVIYINIIIFILFIISIFIIIILIRHILNKSLGSMNKLVKTMDKVTLDNLALINVDDDTKEMNILANSYNKMMLKIDELLKELNESQLKLKDAEYKSLVQQIKPHFLYNTLEMIQSMCLDLDGDEKIENAISLLASYFRISLSFDREFIPLKKELEHITNYINIQKIRYEGLFDYKIDCKIDESIPFLRFTLQPIVENAIYHGVKELNHYSLIEININKHNNDIVVEIVNEAKEIDYEKISKLNRLFEQEGNVNEYPGYGLYNINQRLKLHFGSLYALKIKTDDKYVKIICRHPYLEVADENIDNR